MNNRKFHSCFIIDVEQNGNVFTLSDSAHCRWKVDISQSGIAAEFKSWMENVFLKGIPQTLTVFEYEDKGDSPDFDFYIKKFCNIHTGTQLNG